MAISRVGVEPSVVDVSGAASSITAALPAGIAVGDLMILVVCENKAGLTITAPGDGWSLLDGPTLETAATHLVYYKFATTTGGGTAPTVTSDNTGQWRADVAAYRGVDSASPFIAHGAQIESGGSGTTVHSAPALTNTDAGAWGLFGGSFRQVVTPASWTPGAGLVEHTDSDTGNSTSVNLTQCFADSDGPVAVGSVTYSATSSSGSAQAMMWSALLRPSGAAASPILFSRWVGAVDTTSATVATKTANATSVRLKVATDSALTTGVVFSSPATPDSDGMAKPTITGLTANTTYYYGVEMDGTLDAAVGSFRTFPSGAASFSFAFGSCTNTTDSPTFARIAARDPLLFLHLGDLRYYNPSANDQSVFRAMYDEVLATTDEGGLYANVSTVYTWSDHDFGGSNSDGSDPAKPAAQAVYRQYVPHYTLPDSAGIYHSFVVGRVRFIITDNRSYKSDKDSVDDSSKTMLGTVQKQWLKDEITNATEPLIVWGCENPWNCDATDPDTWGGYTTERAELAAHIVASGKQVVILSGDMHALAADDGTNTAGGIPVFQAAPFHNFTGTKPGTYSKGTYTVGSGGGRYYGWADVTDDGTTVTLALTGYNNSDVAQITMSVAVGPGAALDKLRLGTGTVSLAYGSSPVDAAYYGTTQVWP